MPYILFYTNSDDRLLLSPPDLELALPLLLLSLRDKLIPSPSSNCQLFHIYIDSKASKDGKSSKDKKKKQCIQQHFFIQSLHRENKCFVSVLWIQNEFLCEVFSNAVLLHEDDHYSTTYTVSSDVIHDSWPTDFTEFNTASFMPSSYFFTVDSSPLLYKSGGGWTKSESINAKSQGSQHRKRHNSLYYGKDSRCFVETDNLHSLTSEPRLRKFQNKYNNTVCHISSFLPHDEPTKSI